MFVFGFVFLSLYLLGCCKLACQYCCNLFCEGSSLSFYASNGSINSPSLVTYAVRFIVVLGLLLVNWNHFSISDVLYVLVCANSTTLICQVSYLAIRFAFACTDAVYPVWAWDVRISPIHFHARWRWPNLALVFVMVALWNRTDHYIFALLFLSFFCLFFCLV